MSSGEGSLAIPAKFLPGVGEQRRGVLKRSSWLFQTPERLCWWLLVFHPNVLSEPLFSGCYVFTSVILNFLCVTRSPIEPFLTAKNLREGFQIKKGKSMVFRISPPSMHRLFPRKNVPPLLLSEMSPQIPQIQSHFRYFIFFYLILAFFSPGFGTRATFKAVLMGVFI